MKVLQINAIYGSKSTGTIVREIRSYCDAHGIDNYVAYSLADRPQKDIPRSYRIGNMLTAKWHALMSRIFGKQAYFNRLTTWLFLRWVNRIQPDVVHLHNLHSNFIHLNMLLHYLAKHDIATVITMHDCWYFTGGCTHYTSSKCLRWQTDCGNCKCLNKIPSWFFDTTSQVLKDRRKYLNAIPRIMLVGVSEWTANQARMSKIKKLEICHIYNGYDFTIFQPVESNLRDKLGINDKIVILGPANKWLLKINKPTLDYFINHMYPDMVLVLFGASDVSLNLGNQVLLLDYIKDPNEMAQLYSMSNVFVNCSREDTLSSINVESQACGTPVVTYDNTGLRETVDQMCGFAVRTGDEKALWEKTIRTIKTGKDSLADLCRKWAVSCFEKDSNYMKYLSLYDDLYCLKSCKK